MEISFEIAGDVQVRRRLLRFADKSRDMRPAFERVHESFLRFERRQFDTEGNSGSGGWEPLKPATVARKARLDLDPRILRATERLRKSLTNKSHPDHVKRIRPDEFFFGTAVPYAGPHQNPRDSNPLPRRRVVELTESKRRAIVRVIQRHLVEGETK